MSENGETGINYDGMAGPTDIPLRSKCPNCGHVVWADETVNQDLHDGAALRRLREALPGPEHGVFHADVSLFADQTIIEVVKFGDAGVTAIAHGDNIAEAADKCREALG